MATINTGSSNPIASGQIVQADHVLPIIKALNGLDTTDIIIKGNVTFNGSGVSFDTSTVPMTAGAGTFTSPLTASTTLYVGQNATVVGQVSASMVKATNITGSAISASTVVWAPTITGSNIQATNTLAFSSLGTIVTGSGSIPLITHTVTQSGATGNQVTFGGSQFRDYLILGNASPRVGLGASAVINTASLASGSFITNLPAFTATPATLLVTSSDAFVLKVATNARSQSFAISSSGFVGINTWAPREALDVQLGNVAIKNPTTTSGSILYVENATGRVLDVTNQVTNSIFTIQNISGVPIMDVGTNSAAASYVAVTGNGGGLSPALSSSFSLISASMALSFTTGSTVTAGAADLVIVATGNVTLPTVAAAGIGRYYIVKNANTSVTTITVSSASPINGPTTLGATSASRYMSDGQSTWYTL